MSARKKKPNPLKQQKLALAQQRNEFIFRLKQFCEQSLASNIFKLLPPSEIDRLYFFRCRPFRLNQGNVSLKGLEDTKWQCSLMLKTSMIPFKIGKYSELSVYDYFNLGFTLFLYGERLKLNEFLNSDKIKSELAPLKIFFTGPLYDLAWQEYYGIINLIPLLHSHLSLGLCIFKHQIKTKIAGINGFYFCADLYSLQTIKSDVTIENKKRPIYHVAWTKAVPDLHLDYITISSEELEMSPGKVFDVYIQSHALKRLTERMDGVPEGILHFSLYDSLKNLKVIKSKNGGYLFEFRLINNKTGYLQGDIVEGKLVLLTFLFLTNNGTPEGEKLHKNTGLMKADKIYLDIDKLSAFVHSDIASNEKVKEIFINAGCGSLFEIDKNIYYPPDGMKEKSLAALIIKHLRLDMDSPSIDNLI